jgi:hypothetical protein
MKNIASQDRERWGLVVMVGPGRGAALAGAEAQARWGVPKPEGDMGTQKCGLVLRPPQPDPTPQPAPRPYAIPSSRPAPIPVVTNHNGAGDWAG